MNINDFAKEIHENSVAHGWWEEDRGLPEVIALCHSELSEALEEYRRGRPMVYALVIEGPEEITPRYETDIQLFANLKPEGIAVEMIDCMIRILDWCAKEGVDVEAVLKAKHEYNKTRPYKHGGKKC